MTVRIATCACLPAADRDRAPLEQALRRAGVDARWIAWDDPAADWDASLPTLVRSTWNYAADRDAFLGWVDRAARAAPLFNPPDILRVNTHKSYLLDLAKRGVPVAPMRLVERGGSLSFAELEWTRVVVKPAVGAGSEGVRLFDADNPAAAAHVRELARRDAVIVQPYLDSVRAYGEHSLVWLGGELSHAVRKDPRWDGDDERITGPFPILADERAVATAALEPYRERIVYGRVDLARGARGEPLVMELELTEPSLFFDFAAGSADRFVAAWLERVRSL